MRACDGHRLAPFLALCTLVLATGCRRPPSIVGNWKGVLFEQDVLAHFRDDGTLTISIKEGDMRADLSGAYSIDPKVLHLSIKDYAFRQVPETLVPLARKLFDPIKGKAYSLPYHFRDADDLAVTFEGKEDVLKRSTEP